MQHLLLRPFPNDRVQISSWKWQRDAKSFEREIKTIAMELPSSYRQNLIDDRCLSSGARRSPIIAWQFLLQQDQQCSRSSNKRKPTYVAGVRRTDIITWVEHASRRVASHDVQGDPSTEKETNGIVTVAFQAQETGNGNCSVYLIIACDAVHIYSFAIRFLIRRLSVENDDLWFPLISLID